MNLSNYAKNIRFLERAGILSGVVPVHEQGAWYVVRLSRGYRETRFGPFASQPEADAFVETYTRSYHRTLHGNGFGGNRKYEPILSNIYRNPPAKYHVKGGTSWQRIPLAASGVAKRPVRTAGSVGWITTNARASACCVGRLTHR